MGTIRDLVYDDEECELFCWHVAEVLATLDAIDAAHGPAYGEEYRKELADLIRGRVQIPR